MPVIKGENGLEGRSIEPRHDLEEEDATGEQQTVVVWRVEEAEYMPNAFLWDKGDVH